MCKGIRISACFALKIMHVFTFVSAHDKKRIKAIIEVFTISDKRKNCSSKICLSFVIDLVSLMISFVFKFANIRDYKMTQVLLYDCTAPSA